MNEKLKNFLFLAMQRGGNVSPQMRQQAQSGNLPMMQMGNDIQKMNQRQAAHYGYFQAGGEQEQIDQEYLSPMASYSQRVSDFLKNLKEQAMGAVQDEMVQTNDAYAEEADAITGMPMAQYGAQYNQPGIDAAKAWEAMSKKRTNTMEPLIGAASLATGLKGYFGDDAAFAANPYNEQYIKKVKYKNIKGTEPVIPIEQPVNQQLNQNLQPGGSVGLAPRGTYGQELFRGVDVFQQKPFEINVPYMQAATQGKLYDDQTVANARAMGWGDDVAGYEKSGWAPKSSATEKDLPGSVESKRTSANKSQPAATTTATNQAPAGTVVVKNSDGTESSISPEEVKKREEAKKAEEAKTEETATKSKTETDKEKKTVGDGYDYLRGLADPNSMQAGAIYTTDKKGNQVPMAFYDPNLRVISTTADYRNPLGNLFRGEDKKKRGSLKSLTVRYGTLADGTPVPLDDQNRPITESSNVNDVTGGKEVTGIKPNPVFDTTWSTGKQMPTYPGGQPAITIPGTTKTASTTATGDLVPGGVQVNQQQIVPETAGLTQRQREKIEKINQRTKRKVSDIEADSRNAVQGAGAPELSEVDKIRQRLSQMPQSGYTTRGNVGVENARQNVNYLIDAGYINDAMQRLQGYGYANGGALSKFIKQYGGNSQAPVDPDSGLPIESNLDKISDNNKLYTNIKEAKYKFGQSNPFLAPAMMAGLDTLAGVAQNRDAAQKEKELRGRLAFDQIGFKVPQTSGSQGDWTFNEGYMRPNDMVPVQFQGAGPLAQMGGALNEGDELYLDDETINAILAAGGQIEYLD